jgi:hypothetical protein
MVFYLNKEKVREMDQFLLPPGDPIEFYDRATISSDYILILPCITLSVLYLCIIIKNISC